MLVFIFVRLSAVAAIHGTVMVRKYLNKRNVHQCQPIIYNIQTKVKLKRKKQDY